MDITEMHAMLEILVENANEELNKGLENVDTCEMGKVIDMIKDLSEAIYRRTVTESMQSVSNSVSTFEKMSHDMCVDVNSWKNSVSNEERELLKQELQRIVQSL